MRPDLADDGVAEGNVGDEVAVHDVDVQPVGALGHGGAAGEAEGSEVGGEDGGGEFGGWGHDGGGWVDLMRWLFSMYCMRLAEAEV